MAWADLTDCRAYYELIGEGEPLLLIPGLGATCRLWDPIVPELARHFTLIMLDNRGMGLSKAKRKPRTPVIAPAELPIGVITALIGAPFFIVVMRTSREGAT